MKGRHLACNSTQTSCWVLKSTDRYFFEAVFFHYALKAPCSAPDYFPWHSPSWQCKAKASGQIASAWFILSQVAAMPLLVQIPLFVVFLQEDFLLHTTFIRIFIWAPVMCVGGREEHNTLSPPHLCCPPPATASPWFPLPLQPTQTEILRLIMASADKMKKAIKCVQRGTLWSLSNIPLPLILSTVNTLMTQTTWPRGCKAGRAPSLQLSAWPLLTKPKSMWCFHLCWVCWAIDQDPLFPVKWIIWFKSNILSVFLVLQ